MSKFEIVVDSSETLNLSLQQNFISIIKKITIRNLTADSYLNLTLEIIGDPLFCEKFTIDINGILSNQEVVFEDLQIKYSPSFLFDLTEKIQGFFKISLLNKSDVLKSITSNIAVLPLDYWTGVNIVPELLASFVTPNQFLISEIVRNASAILGKWNNDPSFLGYSASNVNEVIKQIAAVYETLKKQEITYSLAIPNFETIGQRIRLVPTIFREKLANCLDLTLLFASVLEYIGLNPLIIILKGHAMVGVWLEDENFLETIQDDVNLIRKRIQDGINKIILLESTLITSKENISFEICLEKSKTQIMEEDNFQFLIDIKRARYSKFTPIPLQKESLIASDILDKEHMAVTIPKNIDFINIDSSNQKISKLEIWERKLLDLSFRNTLLSFRENKNTIKIISNSLFQLEDLLSSNEEFKLLPVLKEYSSDLENEQNIKINRTIIEKELKNNNLFTDLEENILEEKQLNLFRQSKTSIEENGANSLYLALGFLRWYENEKSDKKRYSPLILIPVEIIKKNSRNGYIIRSRDEEARFNITLLEMLRVKFGLNFPILDPLPIDEKGIDILKIFTIIRKVILDYKKWEIEETCFLGIFSFTQFIMWNDLKNRTEDLRKNKIVDSLIKGHRTYDIDFDYEVNYSFNPMEYALPISSDSSQLNAIIESTKDSSFILHGPPGTGKSQTITNIISNALYHNKRVLFVAEKMNALNVVQTKLEKVGLSPFCLELHSNKTNKKQILSKLEQTLSMGRLKKPLEYENCANNLFSKRKELNEIIYEMHKKTNYGMSLFDAISKYENYKKYLTLDLDEEIFSENFDETKYLSLIEEFLVGVDIVNKIYFYPIKNFELMEYSNLIKNNLEIKLAHYLDLLKKLMDEQNILCEFLKLDNELNYKETKALFELIELFEKNITLPKSIFEFNQLKSFENNLKEVCRNGFEKEIIKAKMMTIFTEKVLDLDYTELKNSYNNLRKMSLFKRFFSKSKIVKLFKRNLVNKTFFNIKDLYSYILNVESYNEKNHVVLKYDNLLKNIFKEEYEKNVIDFKNLEDLYFKTLNILNIFEILEAKSNSKNSFKELVISEFTKNKTYFNPKIIEILKQVKEVEKDLEENYKLNTSFKDNYQDYVGDLSFNIEAIIKDMPSLRDLVTYNQVKSKVKNSHLASIIVAFENALIDKNDLKNVFLKNAYFRFTELIISQKDIFKTFNGSFYNKKIDDYKLLIKKYEELTIQELIYRLSSKIPTIGNFAQTSEIGLLNRAIKTNGRGISIRKLFDSIPNLLCDIAPCMLMSPISVAQYIDPNFPQFDLIIFDEASQIPTSEAVGAISRGKNLIIVGDPKQLPPTSFFNTTNFDLENLEKEDLESILDDCLTLQMKEYHLKWHYRSKHESLISFSNKSFYDSSLHTFPSPNDLESKVSLVYVNGIYDKSNTRQNKKEAVMVIDEIVRRLNDDVLRNQSMGIVTFNAVQQHLIEELLNERFIRDNKLEEKFLNLKEPIFIKNLENVQGDERDVIIFSIGYGPDINQKITLNFGPLNRAGGYRRLNVAVSRAKEEMIIYTSLKSEQIDLNKSNSSGLKYLKSFLEYATNKNTLEKVIHKSKVLDKEELITEIKEKLEDKGFKVVKNVGTSNYKIDLGIIDSHDNKKYALGIILDNYDIEKKLNIKDLFVNEISVLKQLGWKIYRLWSLDWYNNSDKEISKIIEELSKPFEKDDKCIAEIKYNKEVVKEDLEYYNFIRLPKFSATYISVSDLSAPKYSQKIEMQMIQVVRQEQPICKSFLYKRMREAWNQVKLSTQFTKLLDTIVNRNSFSIKSTNGEDFIYEKTFDINNYFFFRIPKTIEERRDFKEIERLELKNTILYVLKHQYGMLKTDLYKEVSKILGFNRNTPTIICIIDNLLEELIQFQVVVLKEERVNLV